MIAGLMMLAGCGDKPSSSVPGSDSTPTSQPSSPSTPDDSTPTPTTPVDDAIKTIAGVDKADQKVELTGVVDAVSTKNFILTDGDAAILVHVNAAPAVAVGDYVKVTGKSTSYNGALQIGNTDLHYEKVTGSATAKAATPLTVEKANSFKTQSAFTPAEDIIKYSWTSVAGKSGNFTTLNLEGSDTVLEPNYIDSTKFDIQEGATYDVEAYFTGYSAKNNYAGFILASASVHATEVTSITVTSDAGTELAVGGTLQLTATANPGADSSVTWTSDNAKVTVSETGLVSCAEDATDGDKVTITATSAVNTAVKGTIELTIKADVAVIDYGTLENPISINAARKIVEDATAVDKNAKTPEMYISGIVVSNPAYNSGFGNWDELNFTDDEGNEPIYFKAFRPKAAEGKDFSTTYAAENSMYGKRVVVSGVGVYYERNKSYQIEQGGLIHVVEDGNVAATSISLNMNEVTMEVGKTASISATLLPYGSSANVTWTSSDDTVATVENGVITGVKAGTATISVSADGLTTQTVAVTVKEAVKVEVVATFQLGENGAPGHLDGNRNAITDYTETDGEYTLSLTNCDKVYSEARDAKGNGCLKLGSSSNIGSFELAVPENVKRVTFMVAKYKNKNTKVQVSVGGTAVYNDSIPTNSDDGEYTAIDVDIAADKTVKFETVSGACRAMIDSIIFSA